MKTIIIDICKKIELLPPYFQMLIIAFAIWGGGFFVYSLGSIHYYFIIAGGLLMFCGGGLLVFAPIVMFFKDNREKVDEEAP